MRISDWSSDVCSSDLFTRSPEGALRRDLLIALARCPRGLDEGRQSLMRALAHDLELGFDPLDCIMGTPWTGPRPEALWHVTSAPWRTTGDMVERLELYAIDLMEIGRAHD